MYLGDERKTRMETMFQIVKNTDLEERKKLKAVRGAGKMGDIQEPSERSVEADASCCAPSYQ
ncbi:hypothetical protein E2C01_101327 [Portunus trituberculatus]|uniref:Uncharacterized protein n=1 Tax=Portunus trituberculatus TaxID=210409 RepID=A0A5B7KFT4_PORTR|nr:hypothetical protein [Portunus trituberculatus]